MKYANVSVKFPRELDEEIVRFLDETGVYTNKSEFLKEAARSHLRQLNNEPAIAALRLEQLLARAEGNPISDEELHNRLDILRERVDSESVEQAVEEAREETTERVHDRS